MAEGGSDQSATGSQDCFDHFCQPCDAGGFHVEATFYCGNCQEYMCTRCSTLHTRFKLSSDHTMQDMRMMSHRPPVNKKMPNDPVSFTTATHVKDIVVKKVLTSILMNTTKLLVVVNDDDNEYGIKLIDTSSGRQLSQLKWTVCPWQITRISDTEAAVSVPRLKKIVLLRTEPRLSEVKKINVQDAKKINVQGDVLGIAYIDNKFVVTFLEGHVNIINFSGTVLKNIDSDQAGRKIFKEPRFVTANAASKTMFVSDRGNWTSRVVKLNMDGDVLATYAAGSVCTDSPVILDNKGMVYVPSTGLLRAGYVDQISANCTHVRRIIPYLKDFVRGMSYDEDTQQLYVGKRDDVKVYKLS